jgi:hypothetical protein
VVGGKNVTKVWTPKQRKILDRIEADLIERGVPEHRAAFRAETELEHRIEREKEQRARASA